MADFSRFMLRITTVMASEQRTRTSPSRVRIDISEIRHGTTSTDTHHSKTCKCNTLQSTWTPPTPTPNPSDPVRSLSSSTGKKKVLEEFETGSMHGPDADRAQCTSLVPITKEYNTAGMKPPKRKDKRGKVVKKHVSPKSSNKTVQCEGYQPRSVSGIWIVKTKMEAEECLLLSWNHRANCKSERLSSSALVVLGINFVLDLVVFGGPAAGRVAL